MAIDPAITLIKRNYSPQNLYTQATVALLKRSKLTVFAGKSDNWPGVETARTAFFNCAGVRVPSGIGAVKSTNLGAGKNALIQDGRTARTIV